MTPPTDGGRRSQGPLVWLLAAAVAGLALLGAGLLLAGGARLLDEWQRQASLPTEQPPPSPTAPPTPTPAPTPTPEPTATPLASPTPSFRFGGAVISDTLAGPDSGVLGSARNETADYRFASGAYQISVTPPNYLAWSPLDGRYEDGAITVDATLAAGSPETAFGLIARYQDEDNFYFYNITADGHYALDLKKAGKWSSLLDWSQAPQIRGPGRPNRLRLELSNDRMRVYINGALLDEASDSTFSGGRLALAVNTFDSGAATVAFQNLVVQPLRPPAGQP
jgi:hypothetical protein